MRWVVTVIAVLAVLGAIAASAYMNWLFMTSLGKTGTERQVFGLVSLVISGFLAVLPVLITWAWQGRRLLAALVGLVIFGVCACVSLSSAVGFAASNRGETALARETVTAEFGDRQKALAEAESRLQELPVARPAAVIASAIEAAKQSKHWRASDECGNGQSPAARGFCKGYFALKGELAAASERAEAQEKIEKLRGEIEALRGNGAGREADAQAAVIAHQLGLKTKQVQEGLALLLAVTVELVAGFGFYLATSHLVHGRSEQKGAQEGRGVLDLVAREVRVLPPRLAAAGRRIGGGSQPLAAAPRRIPARRSG